MSSKRVAFGLSAALALALVAMLASANHVFSKDFDHRDHDDDDEKLEGDSRVQQGFSIAPVPLDLHGRNRAMVGLGAYLVNATGGCNDCHTCPPYQPADDPYNHGSGHPNALNYLAGGHHFGPFVTSANITPRNGLPAGLTEERFIHTIRTGEDPDHPGQLLQVMPWPVFRNLTDRDLRAIYAYLSSIPPASPGICTGP
ncbi:MAG TPA: cytochrome C [Candidatus Eisenbacteria bacterium]|jgi:hypothetical protein